MTFISIEEFSRALPDMLARIRAGEEIVLTKGGDPVARLQPLEPRAPRQPGRLRGQIGMDARFFEPLPDNELSGWSQ